MYTLNIKLAGLTCESCAKLAKRSIDKIDGVKEVEVQLAGDTEIIADRIVSKKEIKNALKDSDYEVL